MTGRYRDVEWLDGSISPIDLGECEDWPAKRDDPSGAHLYRTPDDRWILDASSISIECEPFSAAKLLLSWGRRLPGNLASLLRDRERADTLPSVQLPLPQAVAKDELLILYGPLDHPLVLGKPKPPLGPIRHRVVKVVIDAGEEGLSLVDLNMRSNHGAARNMLKSLAAKDKDWGSVLRFPGTARLGGYRIDHPSRLRFASN